MLYNWLWYNIKAKSGWLKSFGSGRNCSPFCLLQPVVRWSQPSCPGALFYFCLCCRDYTVMGNFHTLSLLLSLQVNFSLFWPYSKWKQIILSIIYSSKVKEFLLLTLFIPILSKFACDRHKLAETNLCNKRAHVPKVGLSQVKIIWSQYNSLPEKLKIDCFLILCNTSKSWLNLLIL